MSLHRWFFVVLVAMVPFGAIPANPPVVAPASEPVAAPIPSEKARDHTYFLVVNGADPLFIGRINRFCDGIRCAGYKNVDFYAYRHGWSTEKQICCIRRNDPDAKIVLVGYSVGSNTVRKVCNSLDCRGVWVDLLVYIGGDYVNDSDYSRPKNAGRVLNINGHGFVATGGDLLFNGAEISGAANYRLNVPHLGLPKQPETQGLVLQTVAEFHAEKKESPKAK